MSLLFSPALEAGIRNVHQGKACDAIGYLVCVPCLRLRDEIQKEVQIAIDENEARLEAQQQKVGSGT